MPNSLKEQSSTESQSRGPYNVTDMLSRGDLPHRSRRWITILLTIAILFSMTFTFSAWNSLEEPEHLPLKKTEHRFACSVYSEDCEMTAPFIFDSIYSLLKQWPSNYAPNGHSVVPATVAANTLLYHARGTHGAPEKPTFFAFDP
jgi:hypothetical protein